MSLMLYLASDAPLDIVHNPHYKSLSVNEALEMGITDIPEYLLAPGFDRDMPDVILWSDINIVIDTENGTVSATALYLLKTLMEDHIINQDNQMLPCCGHFLMANDELTEVTIVGCPNGIDWSVIHSGDSVRLILEDGYEVSVPIAQYSEEVFRFADLIKKYYLDCPTKIDPQDAFDRNGYETFWREWHRRRNQA